MFAVNKGQKVIVQSLVSAGADVDIKDKVCGVMECGRYCMYCKWVRESPIQVNLQLHTALYVYHSMLASYAGSPSLCAIVYV